MGASPVTKIYVGCAIAGAPKVFVDSVKEFKRDLEQWYHILHFVGTWGVGEDSEVFNHDTACVEDCDVMLAICDHPSTGMGMEIMLALERSKRVIAVAHRSTQISRMVTGIPYEHFSFHRYDTFADILDLLP